MIQPVEKHLYTYFENLALIERLEKEIENTLSVYGQNLQPQTTAGSKSPVEKRFELVQPMQRQVEKIKREIEPVMLLIRDLPLELTDLFYMHYYRKIRWLDIAKIRKISRITLWRRKNRLLKLAKKYLGDM